MNGHTSGHTSGGNDPPATISKESYPKIRSHNNKSWSVDRYPEKARTIHLNAIRNLKKIRTHTEIKRHNIIQFQILILNKPYPSSKKHIQKIIVRLVCVQVSH